jgi:hypothetical protein
MGAWLVRSNSPRPLISPEVLEPEEEQPSDDEPFAEPTRLQTVQDEPPRAGRARDHARLRFYVVWQVRGARSEIRGIHSGTIQAWRDLAAEFPTGKYLPGYRLRRVETLEQAVDLYYREAVKHQGPIPPNYYQHQ